MKKLLYLILLLPLWVNAQTNGTIQKTSATGTIRGSFGSLGLDTLPRVTGALVDGYILKYHAATNKWYASPDPTLVGLQDSLTKKANRTFDNVASGAISQVKVSGDSSYVPVGGSGGVLENSIIRQLPNPNAFGNDGTIYVGGIPAYTQRNEVIHAVKNNTGLEANNETGDIIITNDGRGGARVIAGANGNDVDTLAYAYMAAHGPGEVYPNGMDSRYWSGGPKIQNSIEWIHHLNKSATLIRGIDSHKDFYFWNARPDAEYVFQYGTTSPIKMFSIADSANVSYVPFRGIGAKFMGNVGIGSENPMAKLVVADNGTNGLEFIPTATYGSTIQAYNRASSSFNNFALISSEAIFRNPSGEAGRFNSSGNLKLKQVLYLKDGGEALRTDGAGSNNTYGYFPNASGGAIWGIENSTGGSIFTGSQPYATVLGHTGAFPVQIATSGIPRLTISGSGAIDAANDISVPDEVYGSGWDGSMEVPTKNAIYDAIQSGTYTPTLTGVANVASSSANLGRYTRIGQNVTMYGHISVTPSVTATNTSIRLSLPIGATLGSTTTLSGSGSARSGGDTPVFVIADTVNNEALLYFKSTDTSAHGIEYSYSYTMP